MRLKLANEEAELNKKGSLPQQVRGGSQFIHAGLEIEEQQYVFLYQMANLAQTDILDSNPEGISRSS